MPKDKISQYAFTPAANTDIGGINIDEGCAPSGINNAIRTLMTQIRDLQAGVSGDTIPLTAGGTGSGTAASARAALGLAIGTNVLGYVTPGASGNVLQSDGTNWTSKASTAVTLDTITGGPLALAKGGTNATTAAQARTNLGAMQNYTAGATGQVLTSTGTGWVSQAASGGAGMYSTPRTAGTYTFTAPTGVSLVNVWLSGGGGGGGGSQLAFGGSGGSGADNWAYVPVTPGTSYSIVIGAGGAGSTGTGSTGGSSTFGGTLLTTTGGTGGTAASGATSGVTGTNGTTSSTGGTVVNDTTSCGFAVNGGAGGARGGTTSSGTNPGSAGSAGGCTIFW